MVQNDAAGDEKSNQTMAGTGGSEHLIYLLEQIQFGDESSFVRLYELTSAKLFGILLQLLQRSELAEEVLQEVYLRVWEKSDSYHRNKSSVITWMSVIARNLAVDHLRKRQAPQDEDEEAIHQAVDTTPSPSHKIELQRELEQLEQCLIEIGEPQSEMVRYAYLHGTSRQELAARFKQPIGTIKTWLHRSLIQLKSCLANAEGVGS